MLTAISTASIISTILEFLVVQIRRAGQFRACVIYSAVPSDSCYVVLSVLVGKLDPTASGSWINDWIARVRHQEQLREKELSSPRPRFYHPAESSLYCAVLTPWRRSKGARGEVRMAESEVRRRQPGRTTRGAESARVTQHRRMPSEVYGIPRGSDGGDQSPLGRPLSIRDRARQEVGSAKITRSIRTLVWTGYKSALLYSFSTTFKRAQLDTRVHPQGRYEVRKPTTFFHKIPANPEVHRSARNEGSAKPFR